MRYQFFICKTKACQKDWAIRALRRFLQNECSFVDEKDTFLPFDIDRLKRLLRVASGESAGFPPRFRFRQLSKNYNTGAYLISVKTEYRKAQEVADAITLCLGDDELTLFDGEMGCRYGIDKDTRRQFVTARLAHQRLLCALRANPRLHTSFHSRAVYHKLYECFYPEAIIDTSIMLLIGDFKDGVKAVDYTLRKSLVEGDVLSCEAGCFVVANKAEGYKVRFVAEGPGKSAQYMGWIENGVVKVELLRRMSIYNARKALRDMGRGEEDYARSRMYFGERFATRGEWKNPADRYVNSYKMTLWLKKHKLDILYGRHPCKGCSEFSFFVCDEPDLGWDSWKTSSFLAMPEETAAPLLALIEDTIPYYYNYYYDKFHVRKEETDRILERLKTVRLQIIENPSDSALGKIAERLKWSSFTWEPVRDNVETKVRTDDDRKAVLYRRRFEIIDLLDFFSWWLRQQQDNPRYEFQGFFGGSPFFEA